MAATDFITQLLQLGVGGVDLKRSVDLVSPMRLARMTNVARDEEGRLATRPGQRRLHWGAGSVVHSIARLQAALAGGEFCRLVGIDSGLFRGVDAGPLTRLTSGFSGQPLSLVPGRPPLSGDSWMYVGDGAKMVKVRASDGLVLPIGLRAPATACVAVAGSDNTAIVDPCDAAGWTNNAGTGTGGSPANATSSDAKKGAYSLAFTSAPGSATGAYYNFWGKAKSPVIDASQLAGITGLVDTTDDDQFHAFLKIDKPGYVDELRLYFIVSNDFDPATLPGMSTTKNTNAYVKSFIPAQFTPLVEVTQDADSVLSEAITARQLQEAIEDAVAREGIAQTAAEQHEEGRVAAQSRLALGRGQWTEFGSVGIPLRRGEFLRIGSDPNVGWSTITGVVLYLSLNTNQAVVVQLDDLYFRGGYELDSSEPTAVGYDWRYRHYDPRTGARSRWSPVMTETGTTNVKRLDLVRQNARLMPEAYGDPEMRQEFSRRGGTLPSNWYYVGRNRADGGCGKDNLRDSIAAGTGIQDDTQYHQPVSTVDRDGNAIYGQPLPVIFGPAPSAGILLGLGDPNRPGHLYWSAADAYDHWPLYNNTEVCSPDEELMNGGIYGGQAFCFSRSRLYGLLISITGQDRVIAQPTSCAKGLAGRYALTIGIDGIYFVAPDGIWKTTGGTPQNLTDDYIHPLFLGQTKSGYAPIDFSAPNALRLALHRNELWFGFRDTSGVRQWWIYSLVFQFWRHYSFGWEIACVAAEEFAPQQLLLGGTTGRVYVLDGFTDDGLAIAGQLRTGALNMGMPRQLKLWGDLELEADLAGVQATIRTYADLESVLIATKTLDPVVGPNVYLIDAFGAVPYRAKDVSIDIAWSAVAGRPWFGRCGPSFVPQPESSLGRITEWDALGSPSNKLLKGLAVEADTFGYQKRLQVMVDGSNTAARTVTLQTSGRQFVYLTFEQLDCRNVRLVPADDAPWLPYELRWLFDLDPLELTLWETQQTDHGIPSADQTLLHAFITLRSTTVVTLTITALSIDGGTATGTATIPSTGGAKQKCYVKLPALKAALFRYRFESTVAHRLYREESVVLVQPWGAESPVPVQPFGTDDLDIARVVRDAEGGAVRGARWMDMSARIGQQ
jgi:hypothetical protein